MSLLSMIRACLGISCIMTRSSLRLRRTVVVSPWRMYELVVEWGGSRVQGLLNSRIKRIPLSTCDAMPPDLVQRCSSPPWPSVTVALQWLRLPQGRGCFVGFQSGYYHPGFVQSEPQCPSYICSGQLVTSGINGPHSPNTTVYLVSWMLRYTRT